MYNLVLIEIQLIFNLFMCIWTKAQQQQRQRYRLLLQTRYYYSEPTIAVRTLFAFNHISTLGNTFVTCYSNKNNCSMPHWSLYIVRAEER